MNGENVVETAVTNNTALFNISSQTGIGSAEVKLVHGQMPETILFQMYLNGLEEFTFAYDNTVITTSVSSNWKLSSAWSKASIADGPSAAEVTLKPISERISAVDRLLGYRRSISGWTIAAVPSTATVSLHCSSGCDIGMCQLETFAVSSIHMPQCTRCETLA